MKKMSLVVLSVLTSVGCSSINQFLYKDTCTKSQWESLGESDARYKTSRYSDWVGHCAEFGTKPDRAQYDKGFERGLVNVCQEEGLESGRKGKSNIQPNFCSTPVKAKSFSAGYEIGIKEHCTVEQAVNAGTKGEKFDVSHCANAQVLQEKHAAAAKIGIMKAEIAKLESEVATIEKKFYDPRLPADLQKEYAFLLGQKKTDLKAKEKELTLTEAQLL